MPAPSYKPNLITGAKIVIGRHLWEHGGVADRDMRYGMHQVRRHLQNPITAATCFTEIINPNPRAVCTIVFPNDLETVDADGFARFITPAQGVGEGNNKITSGWSGAFLMEHAYQLADLANAYATATDAERASIRAKFDDLMLGINLYPFCVSKDEQDKTRRELGKEPLDTLDASASLDWIKSKSDYNPEVMAEMAQRVKGIEAIATFIGKDGTEERRHFVDWYSDAIKKRINNGATEKISELSDAQARDLAKIICCTLEKGDLTITPRRTDPNEFFLLTRLKGFARIYERSQLPKTSEEIEAASKHVFGGESWVKVVMRRDPKNSATVSIVGLRPLNREYIGNSNKRAASDVVIVQDSHLSLGAIDFDGSSVQKRFRGFGLLLPAEWTGFGARQLQERDDRLPATAILSAASIKIGPTG